MKNEATEQELARLNSLLDTYKLSIAFLINHQKWLTENYIEVEVRETSIDFNRPTGSQVVEIIKRLPGGWEKDIDFTGEFNYINSNYTPPLRMWRAKLPSSCRIIKKRRVTPKEVKEYEELYYDEEAA